LTASVFFLLLAFRACARREVTGSAERRETKVKKISKRNNPEEYYIREPSICFFLALLVDKTGKSAAFPLAAYCRSKAQKQKAAS